MSWQDHVDKQLIAHGFTHAAIIGLDGNVWAKSAAFNVEPAELQTFASNYKNEFKHFQEFGITLAGERFIFLSGTDRVLRAKKEKTGLHCVKTEKAIIIGVYEDPVLPPAAASTVERFGDFLISLRY